MFSKQVTSSVKYLLASVITPKRAFRLSRPALKSSFDQQALDYHSLPEPGKFRIVPTKPMENQLDLSLAYSPHVAVPCSLINKEPELAYEYTGKGNSVAVISNGTAVLGLGNLGALASKPVMEGKAVLFNKFAGIQSVDICVDCRDPDNFI